MCILVYRFVAREPGGIPLSGVCPKENGRHLGGRGSREACFITGTLSHTEIYGVVHSTPQPYYERTTEREKRGADDHCTAGKP